MHDGRKYCLSTSACGFRSLWAAKACMFTWQHASLVRLQPHYVCILGNSKCAVTTARHSHSTRQRLIGVKKDRSTPNPCHPARLSPYTCHSRAPAKKSLCFERDPHQPGNLVVGYKWRGVCMHGGLGKHIAICFCRAQMGLERGSWGILEELGTAGSSRTICMYTPLLISLFVSPLLNPCPIVDLLL